MDFSLNEEQEMLKKAARDFLTTNCPASLVKEMEEDEKGYSPELWHDMAELGWMGLVLPEEYGGTGGDFLDLSVLLEEMGRALLPGPFFSTAVFSNLVLLEAASEGQKHQLFPKIAHGQVILTLALHEPEVELAPAFFTTRAMPEGDDYIINGTKFFVPDARVADHIICVARTADTGTSEGLTLFLVAGNSPGLQCNLLETMARDKQCEVVFDGVKVSSKNIIGEIGKGWSYVEKVMPKVAVAKSMEMIGGAQQVLEMSTEHAKTRVQFDQPIGSFQAIQHHCANMLVDVNSSRFLAYRTAWMISEGIPCLKECYMTKAWVSDAYRRVTRLGTQVHGGIGVIKDYDMQLYFRKAKMAEIALGSGDFWREKLIPEIGL